MNQKCPSNLCALCSGGPPALRNKKKCLLNQLQDKWSFIIQNLVHLLPSGHEERNPVDLGWNYGGEPGGPRGTWTDPGGLGWTLVSNEALEFKIQWQGHCVSFP